MSAPDFDRMYSEEGDPWKVGSSWYEQRKIAVVLASLSDEKYARALDPACGTGHLAVQLAERCDEVIGRDASAVAAEVARQTVSDSPGVAIGVGALPYAEGELPGPFDLVVLSEFFYYLDEATRAAAIGSVLGRLAERAEVVAVHWRDKPEDGTISGDDVHEEIRGLLKAEGLSHQVAHFDEEFVLDCFTRNHTHHPD